MRKEAVMVSCQVPVRCAGSAAPRAIAPAVEWAGAPTGPSSPSQRRHHGGGEAVAHHVDRRAGHVHQLVHAENDRDALEREPEAERVPASTTSEARGTPATPLLVTSSVSIITS